MATSAKRATRGQPRHHHRGQPHQARHPRPHAAPARRLVCTLPYIRARAARSHHLVTLLGHLATPHSVRRHWHRSRSTRFSHRESHVIAHRAQLWSLHRDGPCPFHPYLYHCDLTTLHYTPFVRYFTKYIVIITKLACFYFVALSESEYPRPEYSWSQSARFSMSVLRQNQPSRSTST